MTAPNTGYDFKVAKAVLTENDKDRLMCCYLNITNANAVNWDKAAADFGSASVASFRKMIQTAFKKVDEAQKNGGVAPSPAKATPKKRKNAGAGRESPAKRGKGGGKSTKADTPVDDGEEDEETGDVVKKEEKEVEEDEFN